MKPFFKNINIFLQKNYPFFVRKLSKNGTVFQKFRSIFEKLFYNFQILWSSLSVEKFSFNYMKFNDIVENFMKNAKKSPRSRRNIGKGVKFLEIFGEN